MMSYRLPLFASLLLWLLAPAAAIAQTTQGASGDPQGASAGDPYSDRARDAARPRLPQPDQSRPADPDAAHTMPPRDQRTADTRRRILEFSEEIDFTYLGRIAVHADGRVKSYGSYARGMMHFVTGPRLIDDQPAWFTHMELMLRPRAYRDRAIIYVRNRNVREEIAQTFIDSLQQQFTPRLAGAAPEQRELMEAQIQRAEERMDRFRSTGLIAPLMLNDPAVAHLLGHLRQDLIRTARPVEEIENALAASNDEVLRRNFRVIAPPGGGFDDRWLTFEDLAESATRGHVLAGVDAELKSELLHQWEVFQNAWRQMDAARVNAASARLAELLPQVNPELYPGEGSRTGWPWSFDEREDTWKWATSIGLGVICLFLAILGYLNGWVTGGSLALCSGLGIGILHVSTLTFGQYNPLPLESWYFNVRNMTWVWIIYALSLVPLTLTLIFKWAPARWIGMGLFLIAFALHTFALLLRWYVSDRWPNSNMFEAVTTAAWMGGCGAILLELCVRRLPMRGLFALGSAAASMVALMIAYYMPVGLDPNIRNMMPVLHDMWLYIHTNVIIFSYCLIFMAAVTAVLYLLYRFGGSIFNYGRGTGEFARFGGAASLIQTTPDGKSYITREKTTLGQVFDGTTMVLVEIAFVLLWAGTVMGAIWADHSWGRPWGWDPKEVFALNTFIVFLVLIHVRLKAVDKGMWTALIALVGAAVMLFNWIAINFVVTGLHSYA